MTDFRALCAELLAALENEGYAHWSTAPDEDELCLRARAALDEQPVGPTDEELLDLMPETMRDEFSYAAKTCSDATGGAVKPGIFRVVLNTVVLEYARAVLARWAQPAATPIPVAERLAGPEDCDAEGRCWLLYRSASVNRTHQWSLVYSRSIFDGPYTHWLPANALPVPSDD